MTMTKQELMEMVGYNNKENYLLMPNGIFDLLRKDEELNVATAPHVAVAYAYVYYTTWLYRYAKYGAMDIDNLTDQKIKKVLGIGESTKVYNYIFKKGGVLDRLGITKTQSFNEAPVKWSADEDGDYSFPEFTYFKDYDSELKEMIAGASSMKRRQMTEPLFGTSTRVIDGNEYNGTFFEYGKEYTHMIPMEVFMECMTNPELGMTAFYLYSFIRSRYGAGKKVTISLNTISNKSGIKSTSRDKYMSALKAFGLLGCQVQDFVVGRDTYAQGYETEANTYWVFRNNFNQNREHYKKREVVSIFKMDGIEFTASAIAERNKHSKYLAV